MSSRVIWIERKFSFDLPVWMFPNVLERLRGTPARLEDRLLNLPREVLIRKDNDQWSIQEQAGHLLDLEPLSFIRLDDYLAKREVLTGADITNRKTHEANYNARDCREILSAFRKERIRFVQELEKLNEDFIQRTSLHPRIKTQMRVLDFAVFIAEHDDHHLARISDLIRNFAG
jgi:uncharacterized damage-inducible protein DinB